MHWGLASFVLADFEQRIPMGRPYKVIPALLAIAGLAVLGYLKHEAAAPAVFDSGRLGPLVGLPEMSEPRLCVRVIDGDTLELEGGERVRLIGVNTPESVDSGRPVERFGKEAAAFTRRLAEGKRVQLEYDVERKDEYGRTLAYIYLSNGALLNREIVRQGYGYALTRFPYRRMREFVELEREAREQGRGLWAK
jgi:endonuclease YncB( thermonuclease family)